jgi:hypothetical protein
MKKNTRTRFSFLLVLAVLTQFLQACSSDERYRTGVVREITQSRVELDSSNEIITSIGFTCEPVVCETISKISKGDKVYIRLGSENKKNKLLSIRKCAEKDSDCNVARKDELELMAQIQEESERSKAEMLQCSNQMEDDLKDDYRYVSNNLKNITNQESEIIRNNYNRLNNDPSKKSCLSQVLKSHQQSVFESCQKYGCGNNIGGGCYHISGYSLNDAVFQHAINNCGI